MIKKFGGLLLLLMLGAVSGRAQVIYLNGVPLTPASFGTGNLTASAASCVTTTPNSAQSGNSCVIVHLPSNAIGAAFTTSGTYVGTNQFEASGDNQTTWAVSEGSATAPGTTTVSLNGLTDIRIRVSAYTSGTIVATINVTLNTGLTGPAGTPGNSGIPVPGTYTVATSCPGALPNCFVIKADGQSVTDAVFTAGSSTVTTPGTDPPFCNGTALPCSAYLTARGHTTDVGMVYAGFFNCQANSEASCTYNCAQGTISAVNSAHSVTLSGTCTSNSSVTANSNNFYWVSDDSTQLTAAATAMQTAAATVPATLLLPCGLIGMGSPSFIFTNGTRQWPIGIKGCGPSGATTIIPFPKMNCNASGANGCLIGDLGWSQNLLGILGMADVFQDITFWGGGLDDKDAAATYTSGGSGVACNFFCKLDDVWVTGWVWNRSSATPMYGVYCQGCTMVASGSYAGGNFSCFAQGNSFTVATIFGGSCGASIANSLKIGTGQVTTTGVYFNATRSSSFVDPLATGVYNTSGTWNDYGSYVAGMWNAAGGTSNLFGSQINGQSQQYDMVVTGGSVRLRDATLVHNCNMTGGILYDEVILSAGCPATLTKTGGTIIGDGHSLRGACTGVVTASQTTMGLYGTGANVTATTCTQTTPGAGVPMRGARNVFWLDVTSTAAGVNASSGVVTVLKNGVATTITCTIGTGTSCFDGTHTVAFADGDLISIQYTTQAADTLAGLKAFVDWQ